MYDFTDVSAFILRLAIFFLLFSTYPLVAYFLYDLLLRLFFKAQEPARGIAFCITIGINLFPLICALYIPHIGTLLAGISTLSGYLIIYILPVFVHLKHMRTQITNPLLAEALVMNEYKAKQFEDKSPQIVINNDFLRKKRNQEARANNVGTFDRPGNFGGALEDESQDTIQRIEEAALKAKWKKYYI